MTADLEVTESRNEKAEEEKKAPKVSRKVKKSMQASIVAQSETMTKYFYLPT